MVKDSAQDRLRLVRLLVLALLLSAQSFSLAHEINHVSEPDPGTLCDVCSASHGFGSAIPVAQQMPPQNGQQSIHIVLSERIWLPAPVFTVKARAPPETNGN